MIAPRHDAARTAPRGPAVPVARAVELAPTPAPRARRWPMRLVAVTCVLAGLSLAATTGYELWGTGWYQERAQAALADQLTAQATPDPVPGFATPTPEASPAPPPVPVDGAMAQLRIPAIGLDTVVVSGTDVPALKRGPGWMHGTAAPGEPGNAVISGHRSTYGSPFHALDRLVPGDRVVLSHPGHPDAVYEIRHTLIVDPGDVWVAAPTDGVRLTLTTCHPDGSDRYRMVVQGELVEGTHLARAVPAERWAPSHP